MKHILHFEVLESICTDGHRGSFLEIMASSTATHAASPPPKGFHPQPLDETPGLRSLLKNLFVTDLKFYWEDEEDDNEYCKGTRRNLTRLYEQGTYVDEDWDLYKARGKWNEIDSNEDPSIILASGLWLNANWKDSKSTQSTQGWSGRDFQKFAIEALQAQFPDSTVILIHVRHCLPGTRMPCVKLPLKKSHGIVQTFPPNNDIHALIFLTVEMRQETCRLCIVV